MIFSSKIQNKTMEKGIQFLKQHKDVAFATVEYSRPKLRVFQIMAFDGNMLYFATARHKEVFRQLKTNPFVELLASAGDISVRVSGEVSFDVEDSMARKIFETNPVLPRLYPSYEAMEYFRMPISAMDYYDLSQNPPLFEHFENKENL